MPQNPFRGKRKAPFRSHDFLLAFGNGGDSRPYTVPPSSPTPAPKQRFSASNSYYTGLLCSKCTAFSYMTVGTFAFSTRPPTMRPPHLQRTSALRKASSRRPHPGHRKTIRNGSILALLTFAPPLGNHPHPAQDAPHAPACHFLQPSTALGTGVAHHANRLIIYRPALLHADHLRVMGPLPSSRPRVARSASGP